MVIRNPRLISLILSACLLLCSGLASAFPGIIAGKGGEKAVVHSTHAVIMKHGARTVVTVMADYEGPIADFAIVMVVPEDVTDDHVATLKRDYVDRVDKLSAPRFHDFYEPDPCMPGKWGQEWERSLKASDTGAVLGQFKTDPSKKVAKELFVDTEAKRKKGEYELSVLSDMSALKNWLSEHGLKMPDGGEQALAPYLKQGMKLLVAQVDANRIELVGGERAQLSPIRFWTETKYDTFPARVGLASAPPFQELVLYVFDPEERYEVSNYNTTVPPTNVTVTKDVWERVGEFYNAVYDKLLAKNPKTVLVEFAWPIEGCGQPCADAPLQVSELMSLGGDVFEGAIPEDERRPEPPEPTDEELEKFKASVEGKTAKEKKEAKKDWQDERAQIAYVKALQERNKYTLSRLHYRYNKASLSEDLRLAPAKHLKGGLDLPKGPEGKASGEVKEASDSQLQVRFNYLEPSIKTIKCENPERWRWGKRPREVMRLRKTWVADDLSRKSRTQIKPEKVILSPVPALGISGGALKEEKEVAPKDAEKPKEESCGCRVIGAGSTQAPMSALLLVGVGFLAMGRRRRR
jgi:MYXO-CTERM domain-containing protein